MYLRDTDFPTLDSVHESLHDLRRTWGGSSTAVEVKLTDDTADDPQEDKSDEDLRVGTIRLGKHEVPATRKGINALASYYEVPFKFLERIPLDEQEFILQHRIQRTEDKAIAIKYNDGGISEVYPSTQVRVSPEALTEQLLQIFPPDAMVIEWFNTPEEFRLDVVVPEGFDKHVGGDARINDLTHGGIRCGQNRKQNLAPWTQTLMFRLACTNGYEVPDYGIRIDARGADEEDILAQFRSESARALDRVSKDIEHFYDLRNVKADDDVTGLLRRMTRDLGLPERTIGRMENTLADALMAEDEVTMFHLVNHVTNQANDPSIRHRFNARRSLEQAGGQMIHDHAARCDKCHSRLN